MKAFQSYLHKEDGTPAFFVSTIHRESSASIIPALWYYETFAWRLDKDGVRLDLVEDNSGATDLDGAFIQHVETCKKLLSR